MAGNKEVNSLITKNMIIKDAVEKYPESLRIFAKHSLRCVG